MEEELQEQDFLDRCFQEMLDEEDQDWFIPSRDLPQAVGQLQQQLNGLSVSDGHDSEDILVRAICGSTCDIVKRIQDLESQTFFLALQSWESLWSPPSCCFFTLHMALINGRRENAFHFIKHSENVNVVASLTFIFLSGLFKVELG